MSAPAGKDALLKGAHLLLVAVQTVTDTLEISVNIPHNPETPVATLGTWCSRQLSSVKLTSLGFYFMFLCSPSSSGGNPLPRSIPCSDSAPPMPG